MASRSHFSDFLVFGYKKLAWSTERKAKSQGNRLPFCLSFWNGRQFPKSQRLFLLLHQPQNFLIQDQTGHHYRTLPSLVTSSPSFDLSSFSLFGFPFSQSLYSSFFLKWLFLPSLLFPSLSFSVFVIVGGSTCWHKLIAL